MTNEDKIKLAEWLDLTIYLSVGGIIMIIKDEGPLEIFSEESPDIVLKCLEKLIAEGVIPSIYDLKTGGVALESCGEVLFSGENIPEAILSAALEASK